MEQYLDAYNYGTSKKVISVSWDYCNSTHYGLTGKHLNPNVKYKVIFTPDKNRGTRPGNYYEELFFDDKGNLMTIPHTWKNDYIEIREQGSNKVVSGYSSAPPKIPMKANDNYLTILTSLLNSR